MKETPQLIATTLVFFFLFTDSTGPIDDLTVKILDNILFQYAEYPDSLILIYPNFDHFLCSYVRPFFFKEMHTNT